VKKCLSLFIQGPVSNTKLKDGKNAINEFKKLGPDAKYLADLMLFYVETGVKFTNDFSDINETFYSSLETTYVSALKLMKKENLLEIFLIRSGNKSFIVNSNKIKSIEGNILDIGNAKITISQNLRETVLNEILKDKMIKR
jgi:hypothetical protein